MVEDKKLDKWRKYELNAECNTVELFHDGLCFSSRRRETRRGLTGLVK